MDAWKIAAVIVLVIALLVISLIFDREVIGLISKLLD